MVMSMTGYGRSHQTINERDILVEIKSVNHRYFEYNAKTPRSYAYLEEKIKAIVSGEVSRGKLDVNITVYTTSGKDSEVFLNKELARGYVEALRGVMDELSLKDELSLDSIAGFGDIFSVTKKEDDQEQIVADVSLVAKEALSQFLAMRKAEGERMLADVTGRLDAVANFVTKIEEIAPKSVNDYKERLTQKLNEVLEGKNLDEARVLTEVAIFAEKIAVDEETVRLRSHLKQFDTLVKQPEAVGRKLDFLLQEINREINTIGSKCQDVSVTSVVVDLKAEVEKIREQIQNIE